MKIVRRGQRGVELDFGEAAAADADGAVLFLQHSFHQQDRRPMQQRAIVVEQFRHHDYVRYAGLVFQCNEEKSLRGARPLAHDYQSGDLDQ